MAINTYLIPMIKLGVVIFAAGCLFYLFYYILKMIGLFKIFKRKKKIPDEVYEFIINKINEKGEKEGWIEITEHFSKFPKKQQELWVQAYLEVKQELKGGENANTRKT
jgi:hypothetical protein